eukprot:scaffold9622_cov58-Phaeocystis_antarctica.AAC.3
MFEVPCQHEGASVRRNMQVRCACYDASGPCGASRRVGASHHVVFGDTATRTAWSAVGRQSTADFSGPATSLGQGHAHGGGRRAHAARQTWRLVQIVTTSNHQWPFSDVLQCARAIPSQ